jgi:hypothetical protein
MERADIPYMLELYDSQCFAVVDDVLENDLQLFE